MPVFYQDPKIEKSVNLTTAEVGQTIVVKAVDENGKPTEWEAVDLPDTEITEVSSPEEIPDDAEDGSMWVAPKSEESTGATVIDLTEYVFEDGSTFNNDTILKFASGGGFVSKTENTTFWEDVNTNKKLKFVIDGSLVTDGLKIVADETSRTTLNDEVKAIDISFLVVTDGYYRVTVLFGQNIGDTSLTEISVLVEPLTIPS